MPQLDIATFVPQLVWLAISFFVLYFLMSRIGLPRVAVAIEARRRQREDDLERASQLRHEADALVAARERARFVAREEAQATIRETSERLAAAAADRQRELSEVLTEHIGAAERDIAAAKERALSEIHSVAADVAVSIAGRLIGAAPSQHAVAAAVDRVVAERAG
jgi:F-type H+-transporting ATPase subunit b